MHTTHTLTHTHWCTYSREDLIHHSAEWEILDQQPNGAKFPQCCFYGIMNEQFEWAICNTVIKMPICRSTNETLTDRIRTHPHTPVVFPPALRSWERFCSFFFFFFNLITHSHMHPFSACGGQPFVTWASFPASGADVSVILRLPLAGEEKEMVIQGSDSEMFNLFKE